MADDLFGDRLLVIDDEPALAQVIKKVAQDCGFEVAVTQEPAMQLGRERGLNIGEVLPKPVRAQDLRERLGGASPPPRRARC